MGVKLPLRAVRFEKCLRAPRSIIHLTGVGSTRQISQLNRRTMICIQRLALVHPNQKHFHLKVNFIPIHHIFPIHIRHASTFHISTRHHPSSLPLLP
jgi:hypothetical protein